MNRRNIIRGLVASAALPVLPTLPAGAKDADTLKREAFRGVLALRDKDAYEIFLLRIAASEGATDRAQVLEEFESGVPMDDVMQIQRDRVNYNLYGPKGAPVYDENGMQIGGGSMNWRYE